MINKIQSQGFEFATPVARNDNKENEFKFLSEQFGDVKILRYKIPGFEELSLKQKELIYYLSQAALCGRDIIYDQNYKHNLCLRRTFEEIIKHYSGDRTSIEWNNFIVFVKRFWFSNGIHHHNSNDKLLPEFSKEFLKELFKKSTDANFPITSGETKDQLIYKLEEILFDREKDAKKINQTEGADIVSSSATNFYENLTETEAVEFYEKKMDKDDPRPVSFGLNSKLIKHDNKIHELVYKKEGMYSQAIEKIIYWLNKASGVAENEKMKNHLRKLIEYYNTGDLKIWDDYNVLWTEDNESFVDYVNGFIEVYGDPLGMKATWEAVVNFKNVEATKRTTIISNNAQWFEDNSPVDDRFKKKEVKGVTAKVITVAQLGGDCHPTTPIGINLPNADWIRKEHGSKSVTIDNITFAYEKASHGNGFLKEFCFTDEERELQEKYGPVAGNLHTDLHECLGHGSGQLLPGVGSDALKKYHSALEEARADLFALYYIADKKLLELGLINSEQVAIAEYNGYIRNGLMTQLTRVELGKDVQQAHMRNRQLVAKWCFEKGQSENIIEKKIKDNKTYFVINDHLKLRKLFGELLKEIQRIKSEGDYNAAQEIVEKYAVKVDYELHKEVLTRYKTLNIAPYSGFINPEILPVIENNTVVDVLVKYPDNFMDQMMEYSDKYSFLPTYN